jgi:hypothetical protein
MFLPLDTTPMRIQARPAPLAACDAGLVAGAFPHTVVQQHTAVTALRLRRPYSFAPPSPLPACAARTTVVAHDLRRFHSLLARHVHLQQVSLSPTIGAPGASITRHARPPAGAAPAAVVGRDPRSREDAERKDADRRIEPYISLGMDKSMCR